MKSNVKRLFAGPYILWMIGFTIIPLLLIVYYGLTTKSGAFTLANVCSITTPEHMKALLLSLGLSLAATAICLLLSYPLALVLRRRGIGAGSFMVFVFILPMWMNFLLRTLAWQTLLGEEWRYQRHSFLSPSAKYCHHQYPVGDHSGYGIQLPAFHDSPDL